MMTLARRVRLLIKVVGSLLFAVFAFLQIKDLQIKPIIEDINPDSAKRFILIFYYWCWVFGCAFDTNVQELAYYGGKSKLKLGATATTLILLFGAVAAVLLWASPNDNNFAAALTFFFACNIAGFAFIIRFVEPIIEQSAQAGLHPVWKTPT